MILTGSISKHDSLKIVDKFGAAPMYIMTTKGNTEVMSAVNNALEQLKASAGSYRKSYRTVCYGQKQKFKTSSDPGRDRIYQKRQCTHKDRMHW